jgi:uncharacterized membrane protein YqjE
MGASPHPDGILSSLGRIADGLLATVQNRVELLASELHEEKRRLVETVLLGAAVVAFGMMTLTLVTFTVVILFWENLRMAALGGLSALYGAAAIWAWLALRRRLRERSALRDTLNELAKDRGCLDPGTSP